MIGMSAKAEKLRPEKFGNVTIEIIYTSLMWAFVSFKTNLIF